MRGVSFESESDNSGGSLLIVAARIGWYPKKDYLTSWTDMSVFYVEALSAE